MGEEILEEVLGCMKNNSKVILCGATATYAKWKSKQGVAHIEQAIFRRITFKGILYFGQIDKIAVVVPEMFEVARQAGV